MRHILFSVFFFFSLSNVQAACSAKPGLYGNLESANGLCDQELKNKLSGLIKQVRSLTYYEARLAFFGKIDNVSGEVCGVYSGKCIRTTQIPDHRKMNCEHTWPQSKGATGSAKTDIHHLYPTLSNINSMRSNFPFCEVVDYDKREYDSYLGYSKSGTRCFEPPAEHRGNIARAMFYFSTRYKKALDPEQEAFFRKWHQEDPVDHDEIDRNDKIENIQGNRNPFVDHPELAYSINNF